MSNTQITVILLNYKRQDNLIQILDSIHKQTAKAHIFLWNNSGVQLNYPGVDWEVLSSRNAYCWPRWFLAALATTPYFVCIDDDLCFADNLSLESIVNTLQSQVAYDRLIGAEGVLLSRNNPYFPTYGPPARRSETTDSTNSSIHYFDVIEDQKVDVVKGRMIAGQVAAIRDLPMWSNSCLVCDDIAVSSLLAKGRPAFHLVPKSLRGILVDLPGRKGPMALSQRPDWTNLREEARQQYFLQ